MKEKLFLYCDDGPKLLVGTCGHCNLVICHPILPNCIYLLLYQTLAQVGIWVLVSDERLTRWPPKWLPIVSLHLWRL